MFDNSLPIAYTQIRQLVRRSNHATFLAHYADYVAQVRAEVASRTPVAHAFAAHQLRLAAENGTSGGKGGGT